LTDTPAAHVVVIEPDDSPVPDLASLLREVPASVRVAVPDSTLDTALHPSPHVTVLVVTHADELVALTKRVKAVSRSPLFAIVTPDLVDHAATHPALDDFALASAHPTELQARVRRLVRLHPESGEVLRRGDLALNTATCEVSLGGRLVELTFKEYTLLKYLASNPGRVHSREVLLDKVWGYDYYGGDRTVDVHVRRLRSKIEDANHTFIDTVRNMGYRFRKGV
jgi:DNA-binding response OmpR family regulator